MRFDTMPWDKDFNPEKFREECTKAREENSRRSRESSDSGKTFEHQIETACMMYEESNKASVAKIPEPFRVIKKLAAGRANVQCLRHADPDFMGAVSKGRCIVFEAKYTSKDRLETRALTGRQWQALERYWKMAAFAGVCCGIQDKYYFVPWAVFRDMKNIYGHQYVTQEDLKPYEVKCTGPAVLFLDYKNPKEAKEAMYAFRKAKGEKQ